MTLVGYYPLDMDHIYVLDRFVAFGFAAGRVQTAGGVNLVLQALKIKPSIELLFVACRCS